MVSPPRLEKQYGARDTSIKRAGSHIPTDKPILFICNVGQTSGVATQMATALGLNQAYNMQGGMEAWEAAGYDTEEPPAGH